MLTSKLTSNVVMSLFTVGLIAGCSSNSSSGSGSGSGSSTGDDDDTADPFTNGVSTLSGNAATGYVDGSRKDARFSDPVNVAYRGGQLYVADFDNGKLRVIDVDSHDTSTVISAQGFARPFGLAFAGDGTLYVSTDNDSSGNHTDMSGSIWKVDVEAKTATVLSNAIGRPRGLAVLPDGRLAVADHLHHVIELVDTTSGAATIIAGTWDVAGMVDGSGATAKFSSPYSVAVRADGTLLVTDFDNNRVRVVTLAGATSTLVGAAAGFVDGAMSAALFSHPQGLALAANGDIYVSDLDNFRVRRIVGNTVETIAGDGKAGHIDNDNPLASEIYGLEGIAFDPDNSMVYVADGNRGEVEPYNYIRQIKLQ